VALNSRSRAARRLVAGSRVALGCLGRTASSRFVLLLGVVLDVLPPYPRAAALA